jgi:hypothetical protein
MKQFSTFSGLVIIAFSIFLHGCDVETESIKNPTLFTLAYDLQKDAQGWEGAFAHYPVADEQLYELEFTHDSLPDNLSQVGALKMSGKNLNDHLLMFLKRQVGSLKPSTTYNVVFTIELASQYPEKAAGGGNGPGAAVGLLIGAMQEEPEVVKADQGTTKWNEANFDYLLLVKPGEKTEDVMSIGNIGIPGTTPDYTLIARTNEETPFEATTDKDGKLWVIVGTNTTIKATTTLFYDKIGITFSEK